MSLSSEESRPTTEALAAVRQLLDELPQQDGLAACIDEGRAVAAIVTPLGLPGDILAAVHAYPAFRAGFISINAFENNELRDISRFIIG
ncbi:MAG: hypothetical protein P8Y01_06140, partial [Woeseiaceae bacterium]